MKDAGKEFFHYLTEGDSMYIEEEYERAIEFYNAGLLLTSDDSKDCSEQKAHFLLYSHLCSAYLKLSDFERARLHGEHAVELLSKHPNLKIDLNSACIKSLCNKLGKDISDTENQQIEDQIEKNDEKVEEVIVEEVETPNLILKSNPKSNKKALPSMPKYQYYQNDKFMTIAILESSVDPSNLSVEFFPKKLSVRLTKEGHTFTVIYGSLFDTVIVDKCKVKYMDEKVLIKLKKKDKLDWHELFGTGNDEEGGETLDARSNENSNVAPVESGSVAEIKPSSDVNKPSPYASDKDWNAIERDLKKQEKAEKPEGDEALNKLFQDIYGKSSEDTRRAMIKSFQTSGGTVLSTNWNEVKDADYEKERQAPKGMEWKNWEGDKLEQKD